MNTAQRELAPETPETPVVTTPAAVAPAEAEKKSLVVISDELRGQLMEIRQISEECSLALREDSDPTTRAIIVARGINMLRKAITPAIMGEVMALRDNPLGFVTDRAKAEAKKKYGDYTDAEIKDALIQGMIQGARFTGKEITIISRNAYLSKAYYERIVREIPGLTDLVYKTGVPAISKTGGGALVPARATWKYHGEPYAFDCQLVKDEKGVEIEDNRIACKINDGQGADAVAGKAEKKLLKAIYRQMTGTEITEIKSDDAIDVVSRAADDLAGESAEAESSGATGFDYTDMFNAYELKLQLAMESDRPIVACAQAKAWALGGPETDLPPDVVAKVNELHDLTTKQIREQRKQPQ
jgi:hypothetical protein